MNPSAQSPPFIVIGCGGAGCGIAEKIHALGKPGVTTIAIDTDRDIVGRTQADQTILLGNGVLRGWQEGYPAESAQAVPKISGQIERMIAPGSVVFIAAGLGGGAGSGAAPEIAALVKSRACLVIAIVSIPFAIQQRWITQGRESLMRLRRFTDSVIVIDNEQFRQRYGSLHIPEIYAESDRVITGVISGIVTVVSRPCLLECTMEDIQTIFRDSGLAIVLDAESELNPKNLADSVVRKCWYSTSLDIDFRTATGCMILITAGPDICLCETGIIASDLTCNLNPHTSIIWGAMVERPMEGRVRVYAVMTGIPLPKISDKSPGQRKFVTDYSGQVPDTTSSFEWI
jgi:cell division protein FtsZ